MSAPFTPQEAARALGGKVDPRGVSFRSPGHSARDFSARILFDDRYPGGWWITTFSPADDPVRVRDHVAGLLGVDARPARVTSAAEQARQDAARQRAARDEARARAQRIEQAIGIWHEAVDPSGSLVEAYLNSRMLVMVRAVAGTVLRFHPACPWRPEEGGLTIRVPAMVAAMRNVVTNEITAVHRTRLTDDGQKVARRMLGVAADAAVKLESVSTGSSDLTVGEGLESCLAALQLGFGPRVWATGSAGGVERLPVLADTNKLILLEERDTNGASARAVRRCAARWEGAGRETLAVLPRLGSDMNDVLILGGA